MPDKGQVEKTKIELPLNKIADFCHRWKIKEFSLFGSALREDFGSESDVDVMVTFDSEAQWSLLDHVTMQTELEQIFEREVDLVTRRGVENSHNYLRRKSILESAEVVYCLFAQNA